MRDAVQRASIAVAPPAQGTPWTILQLIRWSSNYLKEKGVEEGRLDVEHLLAETLGMDRLQLYLHFDRPLAPEELVHFRAKLLDRARRRPVQYILGRTAFRELTLQVDERVLIPRPETEELVEAVLARSREWGREDLCALDVGTGSGAIALSLALEGPFRGVVATDSSTDALEVARENARANDLEARVAFREGSLFGPIRRGERFHVVVTNPPYVAPEEFEALAPEIRDWEPREALVAGELGLGVIRRLLEGAPEVLEPGGLMALEVGATQAREVAEQIRSVSGFEPPIVLQDLARRDRIVLSSWIGE